MKKQTILLYKLLLFLAIMQNSNQMKNQFHQKSLSDSSIYDDFSNSKEEVEEEYFSINSSISSETQIQNTDENDENTKNTEFCEKIKNFLTTLKKPISESDKAYQKLFKYLKLSKTETTTLPEITAEYENLTNSLEFSIFPEIIFGQTLAKSQNSKTPCLKISQISQLIFLFCQKHLKTEKKPEIFLDAFITTLKNDEKLSFMLFNLQIFLASDDQLIKKISQKVRNAENSYNSEFLQLYSLVLAFGDEIEIKQKQEKIKKIIFGAAKTFSVTVFLYGVYQMRILTISNHVCLEWFLDNIGLYYLNDFFLDLMKKWDLDKTSYVKNFESLFGGFVTKEMSNVGEVFGRLVEVQDGCLACKVRGQVQNFI